MCQNLDKSEVAGIDVPMTNSSTTLDLDKALQVAGLAADQAAQLLLKYYGHLRDVSEKDQAGLVSEADRESEILIVNCLRSYFPDHRFFGEESGLSSGLVEASQIKIVDINSSYQPPVSVETGAVWIIDPLDGTTNYVHRFPVFCISIALQVEGQVVIGLVDAPMLNMRFHAVRERGAFLNTKPIRVSSRRSFKEGLFATGFSSSDQTLERQFELIKATIQDARGIRRAGAAALDLCFVAEGVFDCFWEKNLQPWDTAAGALIAQEAGAVVTDFAGRPFRPTLMKDIIAGSPVMHAEILRRMKS